MLKGHITSSHAHLTGKTFPLLISRREVFEITIHVPCVPFFTFPQATSSWAFSVIKLILWFSSLYLNKFHAKGSSTLAWKIPWMEEPGRLQSIGTLGVGQDQVANTFTFTLKQLNQNFWELPQSSVFF